MSDKLKWLFRQYFNTEPLLVASPGRVNLIGEHTDYNEGFVMPAAINKYIYAGISRREDDLICLHAVDFNETVEIRMEDIAPTNNWSTYVLGVVNQFMERRAPISGFNMVLDGNIPIGAGMSSSAALESAVAFAINELFELGYEKLELVKMAQMAEHRFAGVRCGIMDMFASVFGKKDHVIQLDCRSLEYEYKPLQLDGYQILLFNTNIKHSLASSEYNTRRAQCEQGVAWVKEHDPLVNSLRDVTLEQLQQFVLPKDALVHQRCRYVVEENQRLLQASNALELGGVAELGQLMFASHEGLRKQYEVSCKELDILVDAVKGRPEVLGARMMGGGFGGCTINLVKANQVDELFDELKVLYQSATGLELLSYTAVTSQGTARIH